MKAFSIAALPKLVFGRGRLQELPHLLKSYGERTLLVTGARSFLECEAWQALQKLLGENGVQWQQVGIEAEPSPVLVDKLAEEFRAYAPHSVVGIGGGSALDAAKAIAGLIPQNRSVLDFLEGVGPELSYPGPALPMIAVPTTAGTGSEATKNAVLSLQDPKAGYKKSFRSELLVPRVALVDPGLLQTCPPSIIAANGMDALTQLMESFVSLNANPMTDALALSGLEKVAGSLKQWYAGEAAKAAQDNMAYAALLSGICLAQTGLGAVHGLASPLGAFFPIPHGIVCGSLVAEATRVNIAALESRESQNPALVKYSRLGALLTGKPYNHQQWYLTDLCDYLQQLRQELQLPGLGRFGVDERHRAQIVAHSRGSSMKTNPIVLSDSEIDTIVNNCI